MDSIEILEPNEPMEPNEPIESIELIEVKLPKLFSSSLSTFFCGAKYVLAAKWAAHPDSGADKKKIILLPPTRGARMRALPYPPQENTPKSSIPYRKKT